MNRIADFLSAAAYRIRTLFRRSAAQQELDEELRFHLQCETDRLIAGGMRPADADRAARIGFGSVESFKEESRSLWGFQSLEHLAQDLRYAARRLRQRPGFTLSVIGVLALGVGATTAMFSAVDAALLRPLPFTRPEELVTLRNVSVPSQRSFGRSAARGLIDITDAAAMNDLFTDAAAFASGGLNVSDPERPRRVNVGVVTANFFGLLGVRPLRGRSFAPDEGVPNAEPVAVLSYSLWQRHFAGRAIEGATIPLNGTPNRVIGVMPRGFGFPGESDLWIPLSVPTSSATFEAFRGWLPSQTIARLAPGVTAEVASARLLERWVQRLPAPVPGRPPSGVVEWVDEIRRLGATEPLHRELVGDRRTPLLVLLGATGFLLLIACANIMNLLLSDGAARQREIAVRHVLGASRGRVVRQLLAESVLLAMIGTLAGVALAPAALQLMRALMPASLAGVAPAHVDLRVLAFAACLALATGIAFGLWPALRTTRANATTTIKGGGGHGATSARSGRSRRVLVGAELALTLMLLVGSGLMLRSFRNLMAVDLGMDPQRVATLELTIPGSSDHAQRLRTINGVLDRLAVTPGIDAAGAVNDLPLRGTGGIGMAIVADGMPRRPDAGPEFARQLFATGGYFQALGIPLLRGRTFTRGDDSLARPVAIISETMAAQFWPGADPLGRTFRTGGDTIPIFTVIGIVADVRDSKVQSEPDAQMYLPLDWASTNDIGFVARGALPPDVLLGRLTAAVRAVDPAQAVYNVRTMEDVVGSAVAPRRIQTLLIGAFGALALVLAAFGVYAVVAYGVTQRSRELGIRAALGATRTDLVGLVAREMLWVTVVGVTCGLAGAWALARVLTGLVYGIHVHDPTTFVAAPLILVTAATVATLLPAQRATRLDPIEVMRTE